MELKMLVNSCCGEGCVEGSVRQLKEREQSKLLSPYSTPKGTIVRICKQKKKLKIKRSYCKIITILVTCDFHPKEF